MKIKKLKFYTEFIKVVGGSLIFTIVISSCARQIDKKYITKCDISEEHAHYYVNDYNLKRPIFSDKRNVLFLKRTDEVIYEKDIDKKFVEALNRYSLFDINTNIEVITDIINSNKNYTEYEYLNNNNLQWDKIENIENVDSLTGRSRNSTYLYQAYKLEENNGHYSIKESPYVESLDSIKEEYPYIKDKFYKIITNDNVDRKTSGINGERYVFKRRIG